MQNLTHPATSPSEAMAVAVASARITHQLESATDDVHTAISNVRTRLLGLVQQEVKSLFQEALGGAGTAIADRVIGEDSPEPVQPVEEETGDVTSDPEPLEPQTQSTAELDAPPAVDGVASPSTVEREALEPEADPAAEPVVEATAFLDLLSLNGFHAGLAPGQTQQLPGEVVYEGTVRLTVAAPGRIRQVIRFVDQLCCNPHLRLLKLVGNHRTEGVDIWVGLREPLQLRPLLLGMESADGVETPFGYGPNGSERLVEVRLD